MCTHMKEGVSANRLAPSYCNTRGKLQGTKQVITPVTTCYGNILAVVYIVVTTAGSPYFSEAPEATSCIVEEAVGEGDCGVKMRRPGRGRGRLARVNQGTADLGMGCPSFPAARGPVKIPTQVTQYAAVTHLYFKTSSINVSVEFRSSNQLKSRDLEQPTVPPYGYRPISTTRAHATPRSPVEKGHLD
ncbi:hypothetical protein BJ170DRAFT_590334 [Xylariales sp. AK1849]|nr:hypothetical protein BJ170DRAFT_590334 [Xylariales sp. AK1849]